MKKITAFLLLLMPVYTASAQTNLTEQTLWQFKRLTEIQTNATGSVLLYGVRTPNIAENKSSAEVFSVEVATQKQVRILTADFNAFAFKFRADGKKIGFLSPRSGSIQLWECNPDGSNPQPVTNIEGGIGGFHYSPDGTHLLYLKEVQITKTLKELHPDLPKLNEQSRIIESLNYRHWDTWEDGAYSHIFVADYANGAITSEGKDIMPNEPYDVPNPPNDGEEAVTWAPDGKSLVYACKKEKGTAYAISTNTDLYQYTLANQQTTNLTQGMPGYDNQPVFSPNGKYLAWLSMERAGNEADKNRLMLLEIATGKKTEATASLDQSTEHLAWSRDNKTIYFVPIVQGTKQIYAYALAQKTIRPITSGMHDFTALVPVFNGKKEMLAAQKMSIASPAQLFWVDPQNGAHTAFDGQNTALLSQIKMGKVEKRWVKTTDGKDMLTWVIYPPDFDSTKKYPTLLYCQGGPQSAVSQFFSYRWNFQLMAAHGYIVVAPNRRGLPGFGQAWNDQISKDYGGQAMQDLLSAIDAVAAEPFVDKNKLGAVGASFGGYSVYWLAGNHNNRFKAFIAHCGMFNMESWYGTTEEMWFANTDNGPYWENKANYAKHSPHHYVANWNTPILIIHNEKDYRVTVDQGMQAFTAAQIKGIPSKFVYFADENHWVVKPQNSLLWQREFFNWLDTYLK